MLQLPFIPNHLYNRVNDINSIYGGSRQSGISVSARFPFIFIFTGPTGHQHGYKDIWVNENVFMYTGEGQVGDMTFTRGNLALRDHLQTGSRVFLFESVGNGNARFIVELEFYDVGYFPTNDRNGDLRTGIKFFFKRLGTIIPVKANDFEDFNVSETDPNIKNILPNVTDQASIK